MEKIYISKYTGQEVDSILDLIKNRSFLSRVSEDETNYLIKFLSGLHVGYFLKGSNGIGMYQDENNKWHIEADYLDARLNPSTPGDTSFSELFEKVQLANGTWAIRAKFGLFSDSFISAKGANTNGGSTPGGGAVALYQLNDVAKNSSADGVLGAAKGSLLSYDGTHWYAIPQSSVMPNLSGYATQSWVENKGYATQLWVEGKGYSTKSELSTAISGVNETIDKLSEEVEGKLDASVFDELFEKVTLEDGKTQAIRAKLGLYTDSFLSAKGANLSGGSSPSGGAGALYQLADVAADGQQVSGAAKGALLMYNGTKWEGVSQSEIVPNLTGYATEQWVLGKGYATTTDLDARIDSLVNGAPAAYDTLKEIADVLAGNVNSISDILTALGNKADKATTLSGYGITDAYTIAQIDGIVNGLSGNISTLQGYFTDGVANSALRLSDNGSYKAWGQTFFENGKPKTLSGALTDVTDITSSGTITTNKIIIGNGTIEWDEANKGFKVTGLYSTTYLSAKGANTNGGSSSGGGLITSLYRYADLGKTFADTSNDTFNAYTINKINADLGSRISVLEGKATNVSFTQSLTSGTQIGSISIDGVAKNIYAPTIPTDDINNGVTAYGWGNHASAGYAMASALGGYLPLSGGIVDGTIELRAASSFSDSFIYFSDKSTSERYAIGIRRPTSSYGLQYYKNGDYYYILHSGNYTDYTYSKSTIDGKFSGLGTFAYKSSLAFADLTNKPTTIGGYGITDAITTANIGSQSVASAAKLTTSRSIWGQGFDGTGNVSGKLYLDDNHYITADTSGLFMYNVLASNYIELYDDGSIVLNNGNVGIGTTNPTSLLHLEKNGAYDVDLKLANTADNFRLVQHKSGDAYISLNGNHSLIYETGNTERMRITSSGHVEIANQLWVKSYLNINRNGSTGAMYDTSRMGVEIEPFADYFVIKGYKSNASVSSYISVASSGNVGIGTTSQQYKLDVRGVIYSNTGIFSDGYVSAKGQNTSSDMRLKNVLNEVVLGVKDIANAPSMRFSWKNGGGIDVGSSAQYWQGLLPDAVKEMDKHLEMQYGNIALLSAIAIARNMGTMEEDMETMKQELANLKRENIELKNKIDMLERGIA